MIISDFYAAYNKLPGKKQKCLVHLMREMRTAYEKNDSKEFITYYSVRPFLQLTSPLPLGGEDEGEGVRHETFFHPHPPLSLREGEGTRKTVEPCYYKQLKRILQDAMRLGERRDHMSQEHFLSRVAKIKKRLLDWSVRSYEDKCLKRLSERFLKYWFDLATFLEEPNVSFNNNLCERQIRHNVIIRNRSYQNRSQKGAYAHEVLMSLLQTLRLLGKDVAAVLRKAYLRHRQGDLTPVLSF